MQEIETPSEKKSSDSMVKTRTCIPAVTNYISIFKTKLKGYRQSQEEDEEDINLSTPKKICWGLNRDSWLTIALYINAGFYQIGFDEVLVLFTIADLNFDSTQIGIVQGVGGVTFFIFQLFIYYRIANRIGVLRVFQLSAIILSILICVFPATVFLVFSSALLWPILVIIMSIRNMAFTSNSTSLFIMITNSSPTKDLGKVNGLAQSLSSISRTVSPILSGVIFAWSLSNGAMFPFNFYLIFLLFAIMSAVNYGISLLLPKTIDKPLNELEEKKIQIES